MAKQTTSGKPPISLAPVKALSEPKPTETAPAKAPEARPATEVKPAAVPAAVAAPAKAEARPAAPQPATRPAAKAAAPKAAAKPVAAAKHVPPQTVQLAKTPIAAVTKLEPAKAPAPKVEPAKPALAEPAIAKPEPVKIESVALEPAKAEVAPVKATIVATKPAAAPPAALAPVVEKAVEAVVSPPAGRMPAPAAAPKLPDIAPFAPAAWLEHTLALTRAYGAVQAKVLDHACAELKARLGEIETLARTESAADAVALQGKAFRRGYEAFATHLGELAATARKELPRL